MSDQESFRSCAVGLLTAECFDNIDTFVEEAIDSGHDFVATPIVHPRYSRVLKTKDNDTWKNSPVYDRDDLVVRKPSKYFTLNKLLWLMNKSKIVWLIIIIKKN